MLDPMVCGELHSQDNSGSSRNDTMFIRTPLRIEDFDREKGVLLVRNKTRKKTGKKERPVFLSTRMIELVKELIGDRTEGYIFLNSRGGQWTQTALEHRLQKCQRALETSHRGALENQPF